MGKRLPVHFLYLRPADIHTDDDGTGLELIHTDSRARRDPPVHFLLHATCSVSHGSFAGIADDGAESMQHGLNGLWRYYAEGFDDAAFGKGKDFVESDPAGFGKCALHQVRRPDLDGSILLFDRGDGQPDEVGMPIRRGQDHDGPFLGRLEIGVGKRNQDQVAGLTRHSRPHRPGCPIHDAWLAPAPASTLQ